MLAGSIDLNIQYDRPMSRVDKPALWAFTVSKNHILGDREPEDNHWSVQAGIGYTNCTYKDLEKYEKVSEFRPMYLAEIGWNSYLGRISFVAKRCQTMYYGATMRCFFYR